MAQDRVAREVAVDAEARASAAANTATFIAALNIILFIVVVALGVLVSRSISRPLRRLTRTATVVANLARAELVRVADSDEADEGPPALAAVDIDAAGEIGELADALNRVQVTAAMLLERQVVVRRNTAVMFANIARRTQNLVGRQLALIDDLERNAPNRDLLTRLHRLDHVASRLRRSADSLLVVSGTIDATVATSPTLLVDVIRAALDEIEGYRSVELEQIADVAVSVGLAGDLRLLLAELLENAANFSPPGVHVRVRAELTDECRISIVDHGLGMSQMRLAEENQRLLERERLDLARPGCSAWWWSAGSRAGTA
ncbi:ATP-binding protein [Luedemannella flava]